MAVHRIFIPEVETVYHKDYQCDYYRGVVIDGEDNIVERCSEMRRTYEKAKEDAEEKIALSPLYSKSTTEKMQGKLAEYKRRREEKEIRETICIFENNGWQYIFDNGLYRYIYLNRNNSTAITLAGDGAFLLAERVYREGESDRIFYSSRVRRIYDIEKYSGNKIIWKIEKVMNIMQKKNGDVQVEIQYRRYRNIIKEYTKKVYHKKITLKRKYDGFNELMDRFKYVNTYFKNRNYLN